MLTHGQNITVIPSSTTHRNNLTIIQNSKAASHPSNHPWEISRLNNHPVSPVRITSPAVPGTAKVVASAFSLQIKEMSI